MHNLDLTTYELCDFGQVFDPFWACFPLTKWEDWLYNEDLLLDLRNLKNRWFYRSPMSAKSSEFLMNVDWCISLESRHLAKPWKSLAPSPPLNKWPTNGLASKAPVAALTLGIVYSLNLRKRHPGQWLVPITQLAHSTRLSPGPVISGGPCYAFNELCASELERPPSLTFYL